MMARTHLAASSAAVSAAASAWAATGHDPISGAALAGCYAAAAFGGLMPDIDNAHSKMGRIFLPISWVLDAVTGHSSDGKRSPLTHSLVATVPWTLLAAVAFLSVGTMRMPSWNGLIHVLSRGIGVWAFALGFVSHAVADSFTKAGAPLLYPFTSRKIRLGGGVRTGGFGELAWLAGFWVLAAAPFATGFIKFGG